MTIVNKKKVRVLPVDFLYQDSQPVPFIRLEGKWLPKLGFQAGNKVAVEQQPGLIVIHPLVEEI